MDQSKNRETESEPAEPVEAIDTYVELENILKLSQETILRLRRENNELTDQKEALKKFVEDYFEQVEKANAEKLELQKRIEELEATIRATEMVRIWIMNARRPSLLPVPLAASGIFSISGVGGIAQKDHF